MSPKKEIPNPEVIEAEAIEAGGGIIEKVNPTPGSFPKLWIALSAASFAFAAISFFAERRKGLSLAAAAAGTLFLAIGSSEGMLSNIDESDAQKLAYH